MKKADDNESFVLSLQIDLKARGVYAGAVDGWAGKQTLDAYQQAHGALQVRVHAGSSLHERFQEFLDGHGIKHFSADEVLYLGGSNGRLKLNTEPPESLWPNIIPTLKVLDQARELVGGLQLTSIYRNAAYNKALSGTASNSYHMQFKACDVIPMKVSMARLHEVLSDLRRQGLFKGGIGKYSSFVHVDTRGENADW